jgi:hypothetical protein
MALNQVGLERLNTATTDKIGTNKNIIINGAMQVAQRGTSSTSTGYQTVDRFAISYNGTDEAPTQAQVSVTSGTTPFESGLSKAFKITNGDQSSGAGAADHIHTSYSIEDQDLAASGWNYKSSSSYVTLSFYVKSSIAQNFYFYLQSDNGSQFRYVMETGSLSADTWTKITKTIPGNSNIVLNSDNGVGMYIVYSLFDGTDRTGTRPLNAWAALDNTSRTPDQTATWYTTNNSTWEITGVQLEVGSVATDFEHRLFGQELLLCQRYYQQIGSTNTGFGGDFPMFIGYSYLNGLRIASSHTLNVKMRTTPSMAEIGNGMSIYGQGTNAEVASIFTINAADDTNLVAFTVDGVNSKDFGDIDHAMTVTNKTGGGVAFISEL